jgi:hypothetical protein
MDPHLIRLERRLDTIDDVLRGDPGGAAVGLQESVRRISSEQTRQGAELSELKDLPREVAALRKESAERAGALEKLASETHALVVTANEAAAKQEGERVAFEKLAKWLKIAAGIAGILLAGTGSIGIALLRELSQIAAAVP